MLKVVLLNWLISAHAQYTGSAGDGYVSQMISNVNPNTLGVNNIYRGNIHDGYSAKSIFSVNPDNLSSFTIYKGGFQDGYASISFVPSLLLATNIVEFDAHWKGEDVDLLWSISNVHEVESFDVERSTNPEKGFQQIGNVNITAGQYKAHYYFIDKTVSKELGEHFFYRIKIHFKDQHDSYSEIIVLHRNNNVYQLKLFPNPSQGKINIYFDKLPEKERYEVLVRDIQGALLYKQELREETSSLDLSALSNGSYFVTILNNTSDKQTFQITIFK